jgi:hypothetical protein
MQGLNNQPQSKEPRGAAVALLADKKGAAAPASADKRRAANGWTMTIVADRRRQRTAIVRVVKTTTTRATRKQG